MRNIEEAMGYVRGILAAPENANRRSLNISYYGCRYILPAIRKLEEAGELKLIQAAPYTKIALVHPIPENFRPKKTN